MLLTQYNQEHYLFFKKNLYVQTGPVGNNVKNWWDFVTKSEGCNLPSLSLTRAQLKDICRNPSFSDKECLGAVMAWGGQNRKHGEILFGRFEEIKPIISDLRNEKIDYITAYKEFDFIWKGPKSLGMGAAYFTKLIFFCDPKHQGFIMDQWTSKSTNLLCDRDMIHLTQGHVDKRNDYQTYSQFCEIVRDLGMKLNREAEHIEMSMFSKGGRKKGEWRAYVLASLDNHAFSNRLAHSSRS